MENVFGYFNKFFVIFCIGYESWWVEVVCWEGVDIGDIIGIWEEVEYWFVIWVIVDEDYVVMYGVDVEFENVLCENLGY